MNEVRVPLSALRAVGTRRSQAADTEPPTKAGAPLQDRLGRPLRDLRISVTDRCNFRCSYCMPKAVFGPGYRFLPQQDLLSFEEISRLARVFVDLGVEKIRLTGGEPLMRRELPTLVEQLAALRTPSGQPIDLTLTTNGALLARQARALRNAGLQRITVSLDALDDALFRRLNDVDFPVADVLDGIAAAQAVGLGPIKVNMVVQRGVNDHEAERLAEHFRGSGIVLRFIEFMDVGSTNGWRMDQVLPSHALLARLQTRWPLQALDAARPGETAERWAYADGAGEVGFISSVTQAFCHDCNRARLSTDGRIYHCLFASQGLDIRSALRDGRSPDAALAQQIAGAWAQRADRYSELRAGGQAPTETRVEMHFIGG
ncbi:cyclic pyranopterin phosphate synthase [Inhella inkyongensis]|uniref:GTP 3',8-cyclase n=1 Tax=Inhella inkyongensis TaxID=392593 RepID=A0A840S416_9BURK|nr:GTP 3',8-cyclase MoaA [Inhella inkyongensis]MBB5203564.1 cyclic pyranopterin phosphate synthase [Inhella inkyongensis]